MKFRTIAVQVIGAYPRGGGIWGMCPPLSLMPNEEIYGD